MTVGPATGPSTGGPSTRDAGRAGRRTRALTRGALAFLVLLCGLTLLGGYANKDRCTGPSFDQWGRSEPNFKQRIYGDVCYSDIQYLWIGRDIDRHVFPYVHGKITDGGELVGGSVEYPVLTGLLIWAGAIFAHNDAQFLLDSALLLAPFGLLTAWLLGKLARWRALLWAIGPPLILYAFHNWDMAAALCSVAAVYVVHRGWGRRGMDRPLLARALVGAVLLGIGFTFKLYPAIFVLPLALYVLTRGERGPAGPSSRAEAASRSKVSRSKVSQSGVSGSALAAARRFDVLGAVQVLLAAAVTVVLVNLPFAIAGYRGWRASFTFQQLRHVDATSNSIWFWGFRPMSDPDNAAFQRVIDWVSPTMMLASFALACGLGWWRFRRDGAYPWLPVSAAMLCGFLLLHKVHSPQYTIWLLPMFVLLRVRWGWIVAYLLADLSMGIGIFRWYYATEARLPSTIYEGFAAQAVMIGVWGRAALLVGLFFAFLAAKSTVDTDPAPAPTG